MAYVLFGLGSNVGDRRGNLRSAVFQLSQHVDELMLSHVYESPALLPEGAPESWDMAFLNMCAAGFTALPPRALLEHCQEIETSLGRQRRGVWGPREIDIDLLGYDSLCVNEADFILPHPHMLARDFVLVPLAEIAGAWGYPGPGACHGKMVGEILREQFTLNTLIDTGVL